MVNSTDREFSYLNKKIKNYLDNEEGILTILGKPLQSNKVLYHAVKEVIRNRHGSVLYMWGNSSVDKGLISYINKNSKYYAYTREDVLDKKLVFMNCKYLYNINKSYDLIIIDDISSYSKLSKENFQSLYEKLKRYSKKIILYSSINYSEHENTINMLNVEEIKMLTEPRVMTTRIDLRYDIPYFLYEYILWFKNNNKNVITYVPYFEDIDIIYDYYRKRIDLNGVKLLKSTDEKLNNNVFKFKDKSIFLITNKIGEVLETPNVDGIIVLSADDKSIDYKKILFMCSKVCKKDNEFSEVILVCHEETENIEKAREVTRSFNKRLWEDGYLSY